MKALKNFSCNGVKKKKGDLISDEELDKMGKFVKEYKLNDIIAGVSSDPGEDDPGEDDPGEDDPGEDELIDGDEPLDLSALNKDELKQLAESKGIKFHHNCKEEKLRELISKHVE